MALPTLPGDEKQKNNLDVGQQHADDTFDTFAKLEEKGTFDDIIGNNYSKKEQSDLEKIAQGESEGDKDPTGSWQNNFGTGGSNQEPFFRKLLSRAKLVGKKRGGIIGLIVLLAGGGTILGGSFGGISMLQNLASNATLKNDSTSTAFERRFMKVFGFSTKISDPICANNTKNIKCKMGRISNSALNRLSKKGVTPYFADEVDNNNRKKTGYPTKNPTGYTIDLKDGKPPKNIAAPDLIGYLANDKKAASKILGAGGAFNVRYTAWRGKHITQKLYRVFGLKPDGGLADGSGKRTTAAEKLADATKKLREKIPGAEKMSTVADGVKEKINTHLGKANKGGAAYVAAVASCIGVKAPGYIAAGVAAVQLAQVMPIGMDVILSPAAKAKASGVDTKNSISAEDVDTVGTLLTNQTPREEDGKMTSALDSPILLAAIGVNTAKTAISKNYTPGFSVLTNPTVIAANQADKDLAPACNGIMSPAAMYSAMAVSAATTVALSSTIIGGVIKLIAEAAISEVVTQVAVSVAGDATKAIVTDLAKNDKIEQAEGQAFGDVLGISMTSMFSAGGMARSLPVLKESEVADFETAQAENEAFQRDMDVASLSPFDTSSKYTFLGSIVNNAQLAVLQSGSYNSKNILSAIPGLINFSRSSLSSTPTNASSFTSNYCSHAGEFGLNTENPADIPAINLAGMPCTGLTKAQLAMGTGDAIDLMVNEGWLDESKPLKDTDSIQDMLKSQYIKADTPLSDYITSCSAPETGDYLFNAAGCTVTPAEAATAGTEAPALKNPRSLEAMAVFLIDYQQIQMNNGDDEVDAESPAPASSAAFVLPTDVGYKVSYGWGPRSCAGCSKYHKGVDITNFPGGSLNKPVYAVADGDVISANKANGVNGSCTGGGRGANNIVKIKHANGIISSYWHMSADKITVNAGDKVTAGQQIGQIGNCGQSYGAHLHFETEIGDATDPALLGVTGADASGINRNPAKIMSLLGVDIINASYTDGR